ncbi:MAG: SDR family NAD(P)-dependent oxidoreductase [Steroidobacteraceae bacterium]
MQDVSGKVAFVTGGASGIGLGMARVFLRAGMKVVIADVSRANLDDAGSQLRGGGGEYRLLQLDVTDRTAFARAAEEAERAFGKVQVLCNNAGIGAGAPLTSGTYADWDSMLGVNLYGVIHGVVTFMPRMRAQREGGHIVNTSSMAGIVPLPDPGGIYTTAKFAVRGLSESLRLALAADHIGVSVLCPGLTRTRILDEARKGAERAGADALSAGFVEAQAYAMDPLEVGEATLQGIRRNDAYILPHAEFLDEVRELHREIEDSFRTDLPVHPKRSAFESIRRKMIDDIKASIRR